VTVLTVAEHRRGALRDVSLELLTAGQQLASTTEEPLHTVVVGGDVERFADRLNREGVDVVHTIAGGEEFNHDVYVQALTQLIETVEPQLLLAPHTVNGLDYVPALASRLDRPLVTDAVALSDDDLTVTRELHGSKVETTITVDGPPAVITVRPGEWPAATGAGEASIESFAATIDDSAVRSTVIGFEEVGSGEVDITEADVLVAVGRGIDEEEHLEMVFSLADAMGATVAASRPLIDNGWLATDRQVGQSGQVVTPDVYLAIGISGAVQHVAGMKGSETIIAINNDPSAPIFDIADYGVVGDLFDVVPALIDAMTN